MTHTKSEATQLEISTWPPTMQHQADKFSQPLAEKNPLHVFFSWVRRIMCSLQNWTQGYIPKQALSDATLDAQVADVQATDTAQVLPGV